MQKSKPKYHKAKIVSLPAVASWYLPSPTLSSWASEFESLLENSQVTLVIIQERSAGDDWSVVLADDHRRCDVEKQMLWFREFLRRVYGYRERLIYLSMGDVVGSFFELALMCSRILVTRIDTQFGFPAWDHGYMPAGGACELLARKGVIKKSVWGKQRGRQSLHKSLPVYVVNRALVCEWVSGETHSVEYLHALASRKVSSLLSLASSDKKRSRIKRSYVPFERSWLHMWEYEQGSKTSSTTLQEYISSVYLLWQEFFCSGVVSWMHFGYSERYLQDCAGGSVKTSAVLSQAWQKHIWVDVSWLLPPFRLILTWISHGYTIVIVAVSAPVLFARLRALMQQCLQVLDKKMVPVVQHKHLQWLVLPQEDQGVVLQSPLFRFCQQVCQQGRVEVICAKNRYHCYLLGGSEWDSSLGAVEVPCEFQGLKEMQQIVPLLGGHCIDMKLQMPRWPMHVWLRRRFACGLVKQSLYYRGGLADVVKILSGCGWWDISWDEKFWLAEFASLEDLSLHEDMFSLLAFEANLPYGKSWREVLRWARKHYSKEQITDPRHRVDELLSEYFLILLLCLGHSLLAGGVLSSRKDVDCMLAQACRVPQHVGSVLAYGDILGEDMLREYIVRYFPSSGFLKTLEMYHKRYG